MKEIILSLEKWDSVIDYYRPNGSSPTWYIKELGDPTFPLMWGRWNVHMEDGKVLDKFVTQSLVCPHYGDTVRFLTEEELGNSPHIYLINIFNPDFFRLNREIGFSCVNPKYLDDVRNKKCSIVMVLNFEGYSGMEENDDFEIIEKWTKDQNLPPENVIYINGNLISEERIKEKGLNFKAIPLQSFECWNTLKDYPDPPVEFKPADSKYLFLSYNRATRAHRIYFLADLLEQNLIDLGKVSLGKIGNVGYDREKETWVTTLIERSPIIIDRTLQYNLANVICKEDHENTFISVVTETLVNSGTLFLSEKIWKPIIMGHPFMVFGNPGTLKYLKKLGYRTFDKWIDESYDEEQNSRIRGRMIIKEIERFSQKPLVELQRIRYEMYETCVYNKSVFKKLHDAKYNENHSAGPNLPIVKILEEIWDRLNGKIKKNLI